MEECKEIKKLLKAAKRMKKYCKKNECNGSCIFAQYSLGWRCSIIKFPEDWDLEDLENKNGK